jgi:hypothetical protein
MRTPRTVGLIVAPLVCATLAACGPPPWEVAAQQSASPAASRTPSITPKPKPKPTPTPTAEAPEPFPNDLRKGSLKRRLTAGNVEVSINYWSTLDMAGWTPGASKPLNLSASAAFTDDSEQDIYLSEAKVAIDAVDADDQAKAVDPLVDKAKVDPGYLITAPTSYGQVFTLPAVPAGSRGLVLTITYELLVQTAPDVKRYSRQAAVDRLEIALAP